jgi:hypothetical protein
VDLSESERGALIGRIGVIDCAIDHRVLLVPSCPAFGPLRFMQDVRHKTQNIEMKRYD